MTETLYFTNPNHPNYQQLIIATAFINQNLPQEKINNKYSPLNLVTPHGVLNQPITILIYLLRDKLIGQTQSQKLQLHQWFQFLNMEFHPVLNQIIGQINKQKSINKQKYDYSLRQLVRVLEIFNSHLRMRTVFIGNSITAFDISLATHLQSVFKVVINQQSRKKLNNLTRWFTFIRSTPPFLNVLGQHTFCPKDQQFKIFVSSQQNVEAISQDSDLAAQKSTQKQGNNVNV